jgi:hypothetical protein
VTGGVAESAAGASDRLAARRLAALGRAMHASPRCRGKSGCGMLAAGGVGWGRSFRKSCAEHTPAKRTHPARAIFMAGSIDTWR